MEYSCKVCIEYYKFFVEEWKKIWYELWISAITYPRYINNSISLEKLQNEKNEAV